MSRALLVLPGLLLAACSVALVAQSPVVPYTKTPETPAEFWNAMRYEISLGNFRRAGEMLKFFWEKVNSLPPDQQRKELLSLHDRDGMSTFLRLGNLAELRKQAVKDADGKETPIPDLLVARVNQFVLERVSDTKRTAFWVRQLFKTPEERAYANAQLQKLGPYAVPTLIDALRGKLPAEEPSKPTISLTDPQRGMVISSLERLTGDVLPPLLAALDADQPPELRSTVLRLVLQRYDERAIPYLYYIRGNPNELTTRRKDAETMLQAMLGKTAKELGTSQEYLTHYAEMFYNHKGEMPAGDVVPLWRWDNEAGLLLDKLPRSQAEEYWGLYWLRKALAIDIQYRPAQIALASLLIAKAYERGGIQKPLNLIAPQVYQLLSTAESTLLEQVLDKAMAEGQTATALGAVKLLELSAEARFVRITGAMAPPLLRALSYPDRRVQFAAAESILHIPLRQPFTGSVRVVELLGRALSAQGGPKVLVLMPDRSEAQRVGELFKPLGYANVPVVTGRELLQQLARDSDIDLIVINPTLIDTELTRLLSNLRSSPEAGAVPIILWARADEERTVRAKAGRFPRTLVLAPPPLSEEMLIAQVQPLLTDPFRIPLSDEEKQAHAQAAMRWLQRIARGELPAYSIRPVEAAIFKALTRDELARGASEILAGLPGREAQITLASQVLLPTRTAAVRTDCLLALHQSVQRHGVLLGEDQLKRLLALPYEVEDQELKRMALRFALALKPDAQKAGELLKLYQALPPKP